MKQLKWQCYFYYQASADDNFSGCDRDVLGLCMHSTLALLVLVLTKHWINYDMGTINTSKHIRGQSFGRINYWEPVCMFSIPICWTYLVCVFLCLFVWFPFWLGSLAHRFSGVFVLFIANLVKQTISLFISVRWPVCHCTSKTIMINQRQGFYRNFQRGCIFNIFYFTVSRKSFLWQQKVLH